MSGNNKESLLSFDEKVQARKDHMALLDAKRAVSQKEQATRNEALKLAIAKEKQRKIAAKAAKVQRSSMVVGAQHNFLDMQIHELAVECISRFFEMKKAQGIPFKFEDFAHNTTYHQEYASLILNKSREKLDLINTLGDAQGKEASFAFDLFRKVIDHIGSNEEICNKFGMGKRNFILHALDPYRTYGLGGYAIDKESTDPIAGLYEKITGEKPPIRVVKLYADHDFPSQTTASTAARTPSPTAGAGIGAFEAGGEQMLTDKAFKAAMSRLDSYELTTPFLGVRVGESLENIAKFKMDLYEWNTATENRTSETASSPEELGYASLNN